MKENLKLEKELLFKTKIKEITSISLDREFKIDNNELKGFFIINGEYKAHEISMNKEKFNFKIPFNYEIKEDIDKETLNVEITNFIYDYNKDELLINIEYDITGERKDVLIFDNEESLDEFLQSREVEIIDTRQEEIKKDLNEERVEKIEQQNKKELERETKMLIEEEKNEINDKEKIDSNKLINNIGNIEEKFITYKIYKITETDTLESLLLKYHTNLEELKEYNDLTNINTGSKIIIPSYE